ncbi:MAG: J domain-containing protein [Saprospiraceae bacterium]
MPFIDYYKILEIDKKASELEVKKAYRRLARKYHPDVNPGDKSMEHKFKEINEANEVLSNAENRKKYDNHGKDWKYADEIEKAQKQQQQRHSQSGGSSSENFSNSDFSDFFESMFGADKASSRQGQRGVKFAGQDHHAELHLDIHEIYVTHSKVIQVNERKVRLTIPAGVENGQEIKIANQGGQGINGGPNGNLILTFVIENNTKFRREGINLYSDVDLDLYTALLGGEIEVETFNGKVNVKITPETKNGTKVRLKGKGFPIYKKENEFGDLIIKFNLKTPSNLSEKEKSLFQELQKLRKNG